MAGMGFQPYAPDTHHALQQEAAFDNTIYLLESMAGNPGQRAIVQEALEVLGHAATLHYEDGVGNASAFMLEVLGEAKYNAISQLMEEMDAQLTEAGSLFNGFHQG